MTVAVTNFQKYIQDAEKRGCKTYRKDLAEKAQDKVGELTINQKTKDEAGRTYVLWDAPKREGLLKRAEKIFNRGAFYRNAFAIALAVTILVGMFFAGAYPIFSATMVVVTSIGLAIGGAVTIGLFIATLWRSRRIQRVLDGFGIQQVLYAQIHLRDSAAKLADEKFNQYRVIVADTFAKHPTKRAEEVLIRELSKL